MQLRTILFATDFSNASVAMVPYVTEMAARFGSRVTILNAFHLVSEFALTMPPDEGMMLSVPYTAALKEVHEQRKKRLDEFASSKFANARYNTRLEDDEPAHAIESVAKAEQSDLVVMSSSGSGTFRRLLLGSVTSKVLHDLQCPVMTSAHLPNPAVAPSEGYRSIVCALDFGRETDVVLNAAVFFAKAYDAKLCLVHMEPSAANDESLIEKMKSESLKLGVDANARVLQEGIVEGVRETAIQEKADLLIVGRGHVKGNLSRMWTHLYAIIRESPCPVISV